MKSHLLFFLPLAIVQGLPYQQIPLSYQQHDPFDLSFDELAGRLLKSFKVPGFSIAIVKGNNTYAKGYGLAQLPDVNATADTLYYTGSTTKSFTAASILKLIEEKATRDLSLQSKISEFVPWRLQDECVMDHATLEDALSHRTGMPRHDHSYGGPGFTQQDLVDSLQYLPLNREIRQEWQYCNMMYIVLQQVIEKISGTTLAKFFAGKIWEPLGMKNTFMDLDAAKATSRLAKGYFYDNATGEYIPHDYMDPLFVGGAGGIISSVTDYAIYLRALLQRNPALLTQKSYTELRTTRMLTPPFLSTNPLTFTGPTTYGLGCFSSIYNGVEVLHHSGGVPGFATNMFYVPERDFAGVVMANADLGGGWLVLEMTFEVLDRELGVKKRPDFEGLFMDVERMRTWVLQNLREIAYPEAPKPGDALPHALPLQEYTGTYNHPGYRNITLTLSSSPPSYAGNITLPSEDGKLLHAEVTDRTWPHVMDFEHINAEHFLVWYHYYMPAAENFDSAVEAMKAEFEIGSDGRAVRLGLGYEPSMGIENLIWFDRVE